MNRRPSGLSLTKTILGFLQFKTAENFSPNTIVTYEHDLKVWLNHIGDLRIDQITAAQLREHLAWLHTDYKPNRFSGSQHPLSPKSIRNAWATRRVVEQVDFS
jgi:site-specific recombinase XerD